MLFVINLNLHSPKAWKLLVIIKTFCSYYFEVTCCWLLDLLLLLVVRSTKED